MRTPPLTMPTADGEATRQWLHDRLTYNTSLEKWGGPFGDDNMLSPAARVELAQWLTDYGEWFVPTQLPAGIPGGVHGQCFSNCSQLVVNGWRYRQQLEEVLTPDDSSWDLDYVEGVCFNGKARVLHAWVAPRRGHAALDPTWGIRDRTRSDFWERPPRFNHYADVTEVAYVGVRIPRAVLAAELAVAAFQGDFHPVILAEEVYRDALVRDPEHPQRALLEVALQETGLIVAAYKGRRGIVAVRWAQKFLANELKKGAA